MGRFTDWIMGREASPPAEERSLGWWSMGMDGPPSVVTAGVEVNTTSALGLSAVYSCVSLLSDTIATLPVKAFTLLGEDVKKPVDVPPWIDAPMSGPWMGKIETLSQEMTSLLLRGDAYVLTPRDSGEIMGLVVLNPDDVSPEEATTVKPTGGKVTRYVYRVAGDTLDRSELLHVRGMMLPGQRTGCSPITYCRQSLGVGIAAQRFGGAFFGNGAWPGLVAEIPGELTPEGLAGLRAVQDELHKGVDRARKMALVTGGAKLHTLAITPEDSQFIETRRFEVADVARMFRVPPHLIGDASGSTSWGSGLAEQNTGFKQLSLRTWVERLEAGKTALWRSEGGPPNGVIKLDMDAVLRGSMKEQFEAYNLAVAGGYMLKSEVRAALDMPPIAGIDDPPEPLPMAAGKQEQEGEQGD